MWLSVLPLIATEAQQGLVAAASQSLEHSGTLPIATLDTVDDCHHTLGHHLLNEGYKSNDTDNTWTFEVG